MNIMNIYIKYEYAFSCINFKLIAIKQTTLNRRMYPQKHMLKVISKHFLLHVFTQFSFIFPCDYNLALRKFLCYID